jgi:hypothetical protein
MNWKTVRLELASCDEHPQGSVGRILILHVPIASNGQIDPVAMEQYPGRATVRRFWGSEQDCHGQIKPADGKWSLQCARNDGEMLMLQLDTAPLRPNGEVKVRQPEGRELLFRVTDMQSAGQR